MEENPWTPAIIAPREHVLKFHHTDPGQVTKHAGKRVRVRPSAAAELALGASFLLWVGCHGQRLEVHDEDAKRLWPEMFYNDNPHVTICDCQVLTD